MSLGVPKSDIWPKAASHSCPFLCPIDLPFDRAATEAGAGMVALGDGPDPKKQKKEISMQEKHRSMAEKVSKQIARLGRVLGQLEAKLPAWKRSVDPLAFSQLRNGLAQSRECRERCMDTFEDLRSLPAQPEQQEMMVAQLGGVFEELCTHCDAIQEKMAGVTAPPAQAEPIKNEAASVAGDAADAQSNENGA